MKWEHKSEIKKGEWEERRRRRRRGRQFLCRFIGSHADLAQGASNYLQMQNVSRGTMKWNLYRGPWHSAVCRALLFWLREITARIKSHKPHCGTTDSHTVTQLRTTGSLVHQETQHILQNPKIYERFNKRPSLANTLSQMNTAKFTIFHRCHNCYRPLAISSCRS